MAYFRLRLRPAVVLSAAVCLNNEENEFHGSDCMAKSKEVKTNAMRMLDRQKIKYEVVTYECDEFTSGVQVADMLGQSYEHIFKTIVTVGRSGDHYVFVIPIDKEIDLKAAAREVSEKHVELLHVKDLNKVTGYIRGGCSPIGMKKHFPTVIHESARDLDRIYVSGGRIGTQLILKPDDLLKAADARYADIIMHS